VILIDGSAKAFPAVPVETLALQHLAEDLSTIPTAGDGLQLMELPDDGGPIGRGVNLSASAEELAAWSARHFDTSPDTVRSVHDWFLETRSWFDDAQWVAMRHHSFGIFEAEQRWGTVLRGEGRAIPTRIVGEWHVRRVLGRIPATTDFLRRIKGQAWMAAVQDPQRLGLR
jgi:hypothetical protein